MYWILAIAAAAFLVYLNAFGHDFVLDDTRIIGDNLRIRSLGNIPELFRSSYWGIAGAQSLYRPLVVASYALNYAVHGLSTYGFTAVNVAIHAAVSVLLFALVRTLRGSRIVAGMAGIAFAVHPVHTEAVTGIAGRAELLAALFFLISLLCHRQAAIAGQWVYRLGAPVCLACALLSKESAIALLLVAPVMDALFPLQGPDGRPLSIRARIVGGYVPLIAVALAYLAVRHAVLGRITISEGLIAPLDNPLVPISTMALGERLGATTSQALMTPFAVVVGSARLLVWPAHLSPDYSYQSDSIGLECARRALCRRRGDRRGLCVRRRRAVAPTADRGLRSGILRSAVFGRQQFRHHDRHDLRGTAHVPCPVPAFSSPAPPVWSG